MGDRSPDRLGRFEVLGAWLRIWTPPRDAVVPPVPWRAIVAGAIALVVVLGGAAALVLPRLAEDKEQALLRDEREEAQRRSAFLASVEREQRPRHGRGRPDAGSGTAAPARRDARQSLLAAAESGIASDARSRTSRAIRGVDCEPFPRTAGNADPAADLSRTAAAYSCVAVTARFGSGQGPAGAIGIPFRLAARFEEGRFSWCRVIPLSDRDRLSRPLPPACRLDG